MIGKRQLLAGQVLVVLGMGMAVTGHASADPINVNSTGIGALGTVDPNYTVVIDPDPNFPGPSVFVASSIPGNYVANDAASKWIDLSTNAGTNLVPGTYDYRTTFDLSGLDSSTAVLTGNWASDNGASLWLNGAATGNTLGSTDFGVLTGFTVSSGFHPGTNTLDFIVINDSGTNGSNPSALRVQISGTASVPEPAMGLLGLAVLAPMLAGRRGRGR
jgi:hypothetical protein